MSEETNDNQEPYPGMRREQERHRTEWLRKKRIERYQRFFSQITNLTVFEVTPEELRQQINDDDVLSPDDKERLKQILDDKMSRG